MVNNPITETINQLVQVLNESPVEVCIIAPVKAIEFPMPYFI